MAHISKFYKENIENKRDRAVCLKESNEHYLKAIEKMQIYKSRKYKLKVCFMELAKHAKKDKKFADALREAIKKFFKNKQGRVFQAWRNTIREDVRERVKQEKDKCKDEFGREGELAMWTKKIEELMEQKAKLERNVKNE